MQDFDEAQEDAIILPGDLSLLRRVGKINLDKAFSVEAVQQAEQLVETAADDFYDYCVTQARVLAQTLAAARDDTSRAEKLFKNAGPHCFSIKSCGGQAGYELVAALAKSLQRLCENISLLPITSSYIKIFEWHIESIQLLLHAKIKGVGGEMGKEILDEIHRYSPQVIEFEESVDIN